MLGLFIIEKAARVKVYCYFLLHHYVLAYLR